MAVQNAIASLAVRDIASALRWYEDLLGRPPDSRPMPGVAEWRFPRGGWLQVYELADRAGSGSCTLAVDRIEAQVRHLEQLQIRPGARTSTDEVKTLMLTDPDGNHIAFAEALNPSFAR